MRLFRESLICLLCEFPLIYDLGKTKEAILTAKRKLVLEDPIIPNERNKYASEHLYQLDYIGIQPPEEHYTAEVMQSK